MPTKVFTAITCVLCAKAPAILALHHAPQTIDSFLDMSLLVSLHDAATSGYGGLFDRVYHHLSATRPPIDACLMEYKLSKAMEAAVARGCIAIVQYIHAVHPQRFSVRLLPLAATNGDLPLLKWLWGNRSDGVCTPESTMSSCSMAVLMNHLPSCCIHDAYESAVTNNHFHIAKWLLTNGYDPSGSTIRLDDMAASAGNFDMVQWLQTVKPPRSFSHAALRCAAQAGHLEIVRLLAMKQPEPREPAAVDEALVATDEIRDVLRACKLLREKSHPNMAWRGPTMAQMGRLDLLQSDHNAMANPRDLMRTFYTACEYGHLKIVQWLVDQYKIQCDLLALQRAASHGHLAILEWVHLHDCGEWDVGVMNTAARCGQLCVVQWLHANRHEGCTVRAMDDAARNGHLHVVDWLHENRTEGCTTEAMDCAAERGDFAMVMWFHQNRPEGCTEGAMNHAARLNHTQIVKWLHENRTEGCTTNAMDGAAQSGHLEMVLWLHTHRTEGCTEIAMDYASSPVVVKWLHWNRNEGGTTGAMDQAAARGDLASLTFLQQQRTEGCSTNAAVLAAKVGHLYTVQWLYENYPQTFAASLVHDAARTFIQSHIVRWLDEHQLAPNTDDY